MVVTAHRTSRLSRSPRFDGAGRCIQAPQPAPAHLTHQLLWPTGRSAARLRRSRSDVWHLVGADQLALARAGGEHPADARVAGLEEQGPVDLQDV